MPKQTMKQLTLRVNELNQTTLADKPYGFILRDGELFILRRKGGQKLKLASGSAPVISLVLDLFTKLNLEELHDITKH